MILALLLELSGTQTTMRPSTDPAAVADVVMLNMMQNDQQDEVEFVLDLDGLLVDGFFDWDAGPLGADSVVITPPKGMFCEPADCVLTVPEGLTGVLRLYDFVGY